MSKLPDALKRRDILYGKGTPAEVLREYGDLYLREGKPNDAVEFFGQACYKEGLRRICQMAVEEGDLFLFSRAAEFLQEEVSPEEWRKLGKKALEKGKYLFALKCFEKIGDREGITEARKKLEEPMQGKEAS
jgi:tetratricopeptide (TPR) repeat protein